MLFMAVAGTAVLAFVSWVSLREARRMSGTFIPDARAPAASSPSTPVGVDGRPHAAVPPPSSRPLVTALRDATVAGADDDEALAAAAALWQVLAHPRD